MQSDNKKRARTVALQVQGIGVPVEVRQHAGARRLTLRVSKTRRAVVVTVPSGCRIEEADRFLKTHVDWVRDRLGRVPAPVPLADGATIPVRGSLHRIRFIGPAQGAPWWASRARRAACRASIVAGRPEHAARRLKDWLVGGGAQGPRRARRLARAASSACAPGTSPCATRRRAGARARRTGCCRSPGGSSWRPRYVLDYVAAHEVAHLREMNHGPRFWKLVAGAVPRLEEAKHWLRHEGTDLHRYAA